MNRHLSGAQQAAFGPEILQLMSGALDQAWQSLLDADATLAEDPKAATIRESLARRIFERVSEGERDLQRLREGALAALEPDANSEAPSQLLSTHVLSAFILTAIVIITCLAALT